MKTLFIPLMAGLLLSCAGSPANAQSAAEKMQQKENDKRERNEQREEERREREQQRKERDRLRDQEKYPEEFKDHITKEYTVQKAAGSILTIYNLEGSIKVQGYAGDKIVIEVDETIGGKDKEILEQGKKEVKLGFEQVGDSVVAYIMEPWDTRPHDWRDGDDDWRWHHRRIEYRCVLNYTVKVPYSTNVRVGTVNNGDITVKDVAGKLNVSNVNGGIDIANAKNTTRATTVNGDLNVSYLSNPTEPSSYYTLNGRLTVAFQPNLSADLQFKSMNGAFYTDFDNTQLMAPTVVKNQQTRENGTVYKLNKDTQLRIGSGGRLFKFETLNGNIYIKKQS